MFETAYETTSGKLVDTKELNVKLQQVLINPNIRQQGLGLSTDLGIKPVFLTGLYQEEAEVPLFSHSILVDTRFGPHLVTDLRIAINGKKYQETENLKASINNINEFDFRKRSAALTLSWLADGPIGFKSALRPFDLLYSVVVAETISRGYALNAKEKMDLNVLALIFYHRLFSNTVKEAVESAIASAFRYYPIRNDGYNEIADKITKLDSISDFISTAQEVVGVSLNRLSLVAFYTLMSKLWYGAAAKDVITVALEHPPTWVNVIYTAVNNRIYRNTGVFRIAERVKFGLKYGNVGKIVEEMLEEVIVRSSMESSYEDVMKYINSKLEQI